MSSPLSSSRSSMDSFNSETPLLDGVNKSENIESSESVESSKVAPGTKMPTNVTVEKDVNKHLSRFIKVLRVVTAVPVGITAYTAGYMLMTLAWAAINFIPAKEDSMLGLLQEGNLDPNRRSLGKIYIDIVDGVLSAIVGSDPLINSNKDNVKRNKQTSDINFPENKNEEIDSDKPQAMVNEKEPLYPPNNDFIINEEDEEDLENFDEYSAGSVRSSSSQVELDSLYDDDDDVDKINGEDEVASTRSSTEQDFDVDLEESDFEDDLNSEVDLDESNEKPN